MESTMSANHQIHTCPHCGAAVNVLPGGLDYNLHFCSVRCGWGGPIRTMSEEQAEVFYNLLKNV
jgi:hypothetical protein